MRGNINVSAICERPSWLTSNFTNRPMHRAGLAINWRIIWNTHFFSSYIYHRLAVCASFWKIEGDRRRQSPECCYPPRSTTWRLSKMAKKDPGLCTLQSGKTRNDDYSVCRPIFPFVDHDALRRPARRTRRAPAVGTRGLYHKEKKRLQLMMNGASCSRLYKWLKMCYQGVVLSPKLI